MIDVFHVGQTITWRQSNDQFTVVLVDLYRRLHGDFLIARKIETVSTDAIRHRPHPQIIWVNNLLRFSGWWFIPIHRPGFILDALE